MNGSRFAFLTFGTVVMNHKSGMINWFGKRPISHVGIATKLFGLSLKRTFFTTAQQYPHPAKVCAKVCLEGGVNSSGIIPKSMQENREQRF